MHPSNNPRPFRTAYLQVARQLEEFLNFCTAGRWNYWRNREVVEKSGLFSEEYYRSRYGNLIPGGMSPLKHYLTRPWNTPIDPSPEFDSAWYLQTYREVAYWRHHPFVDYIRKGKRLGRQPRGRARVSLEALQEAVTELARSKLRCLLEARGEIVLPVGEQPVVSILLLLHNRAELTLLCLESIAACHEVSFEVVIVDNASTDQTRLLLERVRGARVYWNEENTGFGPAGNQAADLARGEFILFLNNDAQLIAGTLAAALETLRSAPDIGAVGGKVLLLDGYLQEAGSAVWRHGIPMGLGRGLPADDPSAAFRKEVDYCSGCFLLLRRALFRELGGFHSRYAPSYFEDAALCLTLWERGLRVLYEPRAAIVHFESASAGKKEVFEWSRRNEARFAAAHEALLRDRPKAGEIDPRLARFFVHGAESRQRILLVDDFPPVPLFGSGAARACSLVHALIASGYEVTVAYSEQNQFEWREVYDYLDRSVEITPAPPAEFAELLRGRLPFYQTILASRPNNFRFVLEALEDVPTEQRPRVVYNAEALYSERERLFTELFASRPSPTADIARDELALAARADIVLAVSRREAAILEKATGKVAARVGHSIEPSPTPAPWSARRTILFVGSLHLVDQPNYDSLAWFFREVAPLLSKEMAGATRVVIAGYRGENVPPVSGGQLEVEWLGRQDDLTPLYNEARVFIAPTRYAAGIPYKCLEAAAHGVPIVATQVLQEQLEWQDERELLVADHREPARFAAAIGRLHREESFWQSVREHALARISAEYSPRTFQEQVTSVFPATESAARNKGSAPGGAGKDWRSSEPAVSFSARTSRPGELCP